MKKHYLIFPLVSLAFISCDKPDKFTTENVVINETDRSSDKDIPCREGEPDC